jgi:acetolactate synthase-1/2/3 large subunit
LAQKLESVFDMDGPVLCEIMGKQNQDYIKSFHTRNSDGRIVHRPIEDQAPFLDRQLFLSEMVISPIDQ